MSGWNWALMALAGQSGCEMSAACMHIAAELDAVEVPAQEESVRDMSVTIFKDDAAPVLKAYYDAQPG